MPVAEKINSEIIQPEKKEIIKPNKMGLLVENGLVEVELVLDLGANLGVNLGNDMKESAEDADDFADGDMEFELFERDVGLLQTVIGDNRCLKSRS